MGHGSWFAVGDVVGPGVPDAAFDLIVEVFEGHEEGEIVEPGGLIGAERFEGGILLGRSIGFEVVVGLLKQGLFVFDDWPEIDFVVGEVGYG